MADCTFSLPLDKSSSESLTNSSMFLVNSTGIFGSIRYSSDDLRIDVRTVPVLSRSSCNCTIGLLKRANKKKGDTPFIGFNTKNPVEPLELSNVLST